jgi:hypothetical protein
MLYRKKKTPSKRQNYNIVMTGKKAIGANCLLVPMPETLVGEVN